MNDVTNLHGPDDPETERLLAEALRREAEAIKPRPGLEQIQARVGRKRSMGPVLGVLAAALVCVVGAGLLVTVLLQQGAPTMTAQQGEPQVFSTPGVGGQSEGPQAPPSSAPSTAGSSLEPPPESSTAAGNGARVPIYWIGPDGKLYREWHEVPDAGNPGATAINGMLTQTPFDPDYDRGPWQALDGVMVTQDGDDVTVDLPAAALSRTGVSAEVAHQAIQQLVWTVTAATQGVRVTILIDGEPGSAWGQVAVGEPMQRDSDARSQVWVISPQEGDVVDAGTVTITGEATAFEANLNWQVLTEDGSVVEENYVMAGSMGTYAEYEFTVNLEPGTYVVRVFAPDMSGQRKAISEDNHTFTVQ